MIDEFSFMSCFPAHNGSRHASVKMATWLLLICLKNDALNGRVVSKNDSITIQGGPGRVDGCAMKAFYRTEIQGKLADRTHQGTVG